MPEISIIVPVYNVAQYLHKCVDSILAQSFTDFEAILVDDGSTDASGAICDEYEAKDARVRVIHQANAGLSAARNAGIDAAKGSYLGFVDSDDYIASDMYASLLRDIQKENADLAICGIYHVYQGQTPKRNQPEYIVADRDEAMTIIFHGNVISDHAVNKLYKRHIFASLRYPVGEYHEDSYTIVGVLEQCQTVVINTVQKYYYYHRDNSISEQAYSPKHLAYIRAWEQNEQRVRGRTKELDVAAHQRVCFANFLVLDKILMSDMERQVPETKTIIGFLRHNYWFIMHNAIFTRNRKLAMTLLMISRGFYKRAIAVQYHHVKVVSK